MTARKYVTIWCDACPNWCGVGEHQLVSAARRAARQEGWTSKGGRDYCPHCTGRPAAEPS